MIEKIIKNQNDINKYKDLNKIYIPEEYNKQNYRYYENGNYIRIVTNENCYTQYNTTYCNIYDYNIERNLISTTYTGNANPNLIEIERQYITSDINYSDRIVTRFYQDKSIIMIMFILGIVLAKLMLKGSRY